MSMLGQYILKLSGKQGENKANLSGNSFDKDDIVLI